MSTFYPKLFELANIGALHLKNRIVMPGMSTNLPGVSGELSQAHISYYAERAKGGVGLIIVEHANGDHPRGQAGFTQLRIDDDRFIPGFHSLVEAAHLWGARIALQLSHVGGVGRRTTELELVAPSTMSYGPSYPVARQLSVPEIEDIVEKFAAAAGRAKKAGFDAVEIHGAHRYLIAQFLCPVTNKRDDAYGGDPERRMKLALDVVKSVRQAVGTGFPVIFRLNGDDFMPGGLTLSDYKQVARRLEQAGVDALHISAGGPVITLFSAVAAPCEPMSYAEGWKTYLAAEIKEAVAIPVIAVGVIRDPDLAEAILEEGKADFVAIGRGLLADPEWPTKASQGRAADIRRCISCNDGCLGNRGWRGWPIRCAVNAAVGRERELGDVPPASQPRRVVIVGGGPAGLECARMAACRGHQVTLYEKEQHLGGMMVPGSLPPGKEKIRWFVDYLEGQVRRSGVDVVLGQEVTAQRILERHPDAVVVATGSTPVIPGFRVTSKQSVVTAVDVLTKRVEIKNERVAVVGGGSVGCETAAYLAETGSNKVVILEMLDEAAADLEPVSRWDLLSRVEKLGVTLKLRTQVVEVGDGIVVTRAEGKEEGIPASRVVLAVGASPVDTLARELQGQVAELHLIGDGKRPRKIIDAVFEGNLVGRRL